MDGVPDGQEQRAVMVPADPPAPREPGTGVRFESLAAIIAEMTGIVDGLAAELAGIDSALALEAYTACRYGVKIGTDGRPPPVPGGPPVSAAEASERHWALAYRRAWEWAAADARHARQRAVIRLTDLYATIEPPRIATASGSS